MTRVELKNEAKKQIKGKIGILFLIFLIVAMIGVGSSFVPVIGWFATIIIMPAFNISLCMIFLNLAKGEDISVGDAFKGFNITGKAVWLSIITWIYTFLWSLLFIIPGIIKTFSYSMAPFILADNPNFTASEALSESIRIMNGHKFDLFVLQLSFILWYLLGAITFGIAYIYIVPYFDATMANFYNEIKDKKIEAEVINED